MQSVLVKQHVLDALTIIEKKQKQQEHALMKQQRKQGLGRGRGGPNIAAGVGRGMGRGRGQHPSQQSLSHSSSSSYSSRSSGSSSRSGSYDSQESGSGSGSGSESGSEDEDEESKSSNGAQPRDDDMLQFEGDDGKGQMLKDQLQPLDEDELLLDNFYVKSQGANNSNLSDPIIQHYESQQQQMPPLLQQAKKKSIQDMQEEYAIKKSLQEYEQQQQILKRKEQEEKLRFEKEEEERIRKEEAKKREFKLTQNNMGGNKTQQLQDIQEKQQQAMQLIKNEISTQQESLQERLKQRRQIVADQVQIGDGLYSPPTRQGENDSSSSDLGGNMILKNLNCEDIDPDQMQQDEDESDEAEIQEALSQIEKRKEEIIEEFMEIAFMKKHEALEEVKADCKKNKMPKDQEKKRIQDTTKLMDTKRKDGMNEVNKKLNQIIQDESIPIAERVARLQDIDQIRSYMMQYFEVEQQNVQEEQKAE